MIKESLLIKETAIPIKIARLYLVSDVLHNRYTTCRVSLAKCMRAPVLRTDIWHAATF